MHETTDSFVAGGADDVHVIRKYAERIEFRRMHAFRDPQMLDQTIGDAWRRAPGFSMHGRGRDVKHALLCGMSWLHD